MPKLTVCILIPLLAIYVVSLLIFMRLGSIQDLLREIRETMKKEESK